MNNKWIILLLVGIVTSWAAQAAQVLPVHDDFEGYTVGQTFLSETNGWVSPDSGVMVTTATNHTPGGSKSVIVPGGTSLSNRVDTTGAGSVIWTDAQIWPAVGLPPFNTLPSASFASYFAEGGVLAVSTNSATWLMCSNTYFGVAMMIATNTFHRLTLYQNYQSSNSAVFLDGKLVLQDLRFVPPAAQYRRFSIRNENADGYLDDASITTTVPSGLTDDANGDNVYDANELQQFGYVMRSLKVGVGQDYTTLQAAVNAARARDLIVVTNAGTFNEAVTVDHSVRFGGAAFTNQQSFALSPGVALSLLTTGVINSLTMDASASVAVSNGGFAVTGHGVNMSGTFGITGSQWNTADAKSTLDFVDTFENYAVGSLFSDLWFRGWGGSAGSVRVNATNAPTSVGGRAAEVCEGVLSNHVNGAGAPKVWTDCRFLPVPGPVAPDVNTNGACLVVYVNEQGYLTVYVPGLGWDVCSNGVKGAVMTPLQAGTWARLSIHVDYGHNFAALFLDGNLLRQKIPFAPAHAPQYGVFSARQDGGIATLDDVSIARVLPAGLTGDADGDGVPDALEIEQTGDIDYPSGSIYLIR